MNILDHDNPTGHKKCIKCGVWAYPKVGWLGDLDAIFGTLGLKCPTCGYVVLMRTADDDTQGT